jgi:tetratricopeptide (TPR) repeat protein
MKGPSAGRSYQKPSALPTSDVPATLRLLMSGCTQLGTRCRRIAALCAVAVVLAGCGSGDTRYYLGAFEQNQELRELFRLFNKEKDQENRFVLITQIAAGLANEGRVDREILFLTTHVERNPADIYNGYYLLLVADAYRDIKAIPFAIHYYRRILSNYGDLLVKGTSIHLQCLQELLALETDPMAKIGYYKELFSRFPDQSPGINWYHMAKAYEEVGEWEQSIQAYQKFIGSADVDVTGESLALRDAAEKVNFYNWPDKSWLLPDLNELVGLIREAIVTKNIVRLRRYQARVNFFQEPWDQTQLVTDETVNYNIINYLLTSNVVVDSQLDIAANGREATLRTTGWNFRPSTWYLYFRQVDFPADPDINGQWEWAGIYFGEKL